MKVLLINGSPHKKGCTYTALSEIAKVLDEESFDTEIFNIGTESIRGCIACGQCRNEVSSKCVFDDIVNEVIEKIRDADGIIIGSPVYYSSPNGSLIALLDRVFYASQKEDLKYKPGAAIVSARRAGTTASLEVLNKYFSISNMPIVSSQYWNMVHGYTPEEVLRDKEGLQIMRTLGRNMAWLLKSIAVAKEQGIFPPEEEEPIRTNFIQ